MKLDLEWVDKKLRDIAGSTDVYLTIPEQCALLHVARSILTNVGYSNRDSSFSRGYNAGVSAILVEARETFEEATLGNG